MDDLYLAFVTGTLTPAERAAVEAHLAAHPEAAEQVEFIRRAVAPLAIDRDAFEPPPGLAAAAVARTARFLITHGLAWAADPKETLKPGAKPPVPSATLLAEMAARSHTSPRPDPVVVPATGAPSSPPRPVPPPEASGPVFPGWWRRPDAVVAVLIAVLAVGMGVTAVGKVREERNVAACQNRLHELHLAMVGYSDVRDGRFPQVGTPQVPTAGSFADELARAGQVPPGLPAVCPVAPAATDPHATPVRYTYTLGYYGPGGTVLGLRRGADPEADDWVPLAADLPAVGPEAAHARGQNVLFVSGAVRLATTPAAGPNGDDIYHNEAGLSRAGFHLLDASLGRPADRP